MSELYRQRNLARYVDGVQAAFETQGFGFLLHADAVFTLPEGVFALDKLNANRRVFNQDMVCCSTLDAQVMAQRIVASGADLPILVLSGNLLRMAYKEGDLKGKLDALPINYVVLDLNWNKEANGRRAEWSQIDEANRLLDGEGGWCLFWVEENRSAVLMRQELVDERGMSQNLVALRGNEDGVFEADAKAVR